MWRSNLVIRQITGEIDGKAPKLWVFSIHRYAAYGCAAIGNLLLLFKNHGRDQNRS